MSPPMATVVLAAKFWILDPLYSALGTLLAWFYDFIPSYGVAIVLLTVAVRLITLPLTAKQARSQQALQKLQPELKRLQAKYKGDKQKLNEEMMKFYKEHKVNPFGGCLPLFIQAPVLLVLYRLIMGLSRTFIVGFAVVVGTAVAVGGGTAGPLQGATVQGGQVSGGELVNGVIKDGSLQDARAMVDGRVVGTVADAKIVNGKIPTAQVMNGEVVVGTLTDLSITGGHVDGAPKNVPEDSSLFNALQASGGTMESWGMDLAKPASEESGSALVPFLILIAGVGATGFYQQRQLTARLPKESLNSQMAMMGKIFPIVFVFISWTIPAGVVVYFFVSNIWQIGQQAYLFRNQPRPEAGTKEPAGGKGSKGSPAKGKSGSTPAKAAKGAKGAKGATTGRLAKGAKPSRSNARGAAGSKAGKAKAGGPNRGVRGTPPPPRGRKKPVNVPKTKPSTGGPAGSKGPDRTTKNGGSARGDGIGGKDRRRRADADAQPEIKPDTAAKRDTGARSDAGAGGGDGQGANGEGSTAEVPASPIPTTDSAAQRASQPVSPDTPHTASSPAPPGATTEAQSSNGSVPLAAPLPPAAGDGDKDGE